MPLAIFDLDNTLIADDSDHLWGQFLVEKGYVDRESFAQTNDQFFEDYKSGTLDIMAYQRFALKPLSQQEPETLSRWHDAFMTEVIEPILLPKAQALIDQHKAQGHTVMVITATNTFITRPIAKRYGIEILLGTEGEIINGRYTGEVSGTPTFQEGKVVRLNEWMKENNQNLEGSYFYSDSHNDLPLLKLVDHPIAVDSDPTLTEFALQHGWKVISLR
jgi:HAD superfamily hydrolase (TIGR01490 family)